MGGQGSGNWYRWRKKTTVEDCWTLDANQFMREGVFQVGEFRKLGWVWRLTNGPQQADLDYEVDATNLVRPWFRVSYRLIRTGEVLDYKISLTTSCPNYGGWRWWFLCPLSVGGRMCGRRVGKLYLPPFGRYYGCRNCHDLTYTSCQRSDKRVSRLKQNPEELDAIIRRPDQADASQLMLAFKALGRCYDSTPMDQ
jgi:hypothetical protein